MFSIIIREKQVIISILSLGFIPSVLPFLCNEKEDDRKLLAYNKENYDIFNEPV